MAATASTASQVGNVDVTTRKIISVDVTVIPLTEKRDADPTAEYVLTLNGRTIKRMTAWQAERYGLISENSVY